MNCHPSICWEVEDTWDGQMSAEKELWPCIKGLAAIEDLLLQKQPEVKPLVSY